MENDFIDHINKNSLFSKDSKLLVAVSGGIDSICLVSLLIELKYNIEIAHCNFQLRSKESDEDLNFVKQFAETNNIPFHSRSFNTNEYAKNKKISIQMAARELRYDWLKKLRLDIKADHIVTGHNLDDKIETFFLNIIRGTGLKGLISMKKNNDFIVRPLIFAKRKQIEDYVRIRKIHYREDSSNISIKYKRNKVRHELIPLLKEFNPSVVDTIHNEIKILESTFLIFENHVDEVLHKLIFKTSNGFKILKKDLLQLENYDIYLYELLNKFDFTDFSGITNAITRDSGKQFFSLTHKLLIDREYIIIKEKDIQQKNQFIINDIDKFIKSPLNLSFEIADKDFSQIKNFSACFDFDKLAFPLKIRKWENGDKFIPFGMKNFKKLSDFFIDIKLDLFSKQETFLLCSNNDIIWIIGHRIDDRYKVTAKTKKMYIANLLVN